MTNMLSRKIWNFNCDLRMRMIICFIIFFIKHVKAFFFQLRNILISFNKLIIKQNVIFEFFFFINIFYHQQQSPKTTNCYSIKRKSLEAKLILFIIYILYYLTNDHPILAWKYILKNISKMFNNNIFWGDNQGIK